MIYSLCSIKKGLIKGRRPRWGFVRDVRILLLWAYLQHGWIILRQTFRDYRGHMWECPRKEFFENMKLTDIEMRRWKQNMQRGRLLLPVICVLILVYLYHLLLQMASHCIIKAGVTQSTKQNWQFCPPCTFRDAASSLRMCGAPGAEWTLWSRS